MCSSCRDDNGARINARVNLRKTVIERNDKLLLFVLIAYRLFYYTLCAYTRIECATAAPVI